MTEETNHPLQQRIAAALYQHSNPGYQWDDAHPDDVIAYGADGDIVIRTLKPELDRLADYENRITWDTTCGSCARILDSSIRETERRERAEQQRDRLAAVLAEVLAVFVHKVPGYRIPRVRGEADVVTLDKWRSMAAGAGKPTPPAHDAGPTTAECAAADQRYWDHEREGE